MGGVVHCCSSGKTKVPVEEEEPKPSYSPGFAPLPEGDSYFKKVGCCGALPEDPQKTNYIYTLKRYLANYYYLTGGCCLDYLFFICNWHPLIGIFLSHPNHPWTKLERIIMVTISLSITFVPAIWIEKNIEAVGEAHQTLGQIPEEAYPYIFITLPDLIIAKLLYELTITETRKFMCCEDACRCFFTGVKNILLFISFVCGTAATVLAVILLKDTNPPIDWIHLLQMLGRQYAISWSIWFVYMTILPCQIGFISNWCAGPPKAAE